MSILASLGLYRFIIIIIIMIYTYIRIIILYYTSIIIDLIPRVRFVGRHNLTRWRVHI